MLGEIGRVGVVSGVMAIVAAGIVACSSDGDNTRPGEESQGSAPAAVRSPGTGETPQASVTPGKVVRVLVPRLDPGEYYPLHRDDSSPQAALDEICMGITAAFNNEDAGGNPRSDVLAPIFAGTAANKREEITRSILGFHELKQDQSDLRYFYECESTGATKHRGGPYNSLGWPVTSWAIDVETHGYLLEPDGTVVEEATQTEQWEISSAQNPVTLPDGTQVKGVQVNKCTRDG